MVLLLSASIMIVVCCYECVRVRVRKSEGKKIERTHQVLSGARKKKSKNFDQFLTPLSFSSLFVSLSLSLSLLPSTGTNGRKIEEGEKFILLR